MVQGARDHLGLPIAATGFVLPLAVSVFKLNRTISPVVKLLFLAHVFAIPLGPAQLAAFLATVIVVSFGIAGIPDSAMYSNMPAYLAAGLPLEGVVILGAMDAFADVFKTLLNVTADMSASAILSRGSTAGAEPRVIQFLVPKMVSFTMREYLELWGRDLSERIAIRNYEDLPRWKALPSGTYILAALDQLYPAGRRALGPSAISSRARRPGRSILQLARGDARSASLSSRSFTAAAGTAFARCARTRIPAIFGFPFSSAKSTGTRAR